MNDFRRAALAGSAGLMLFLAVGCDQPPNNSGAGGAEPELSQDAVEFQKQNAPVVVSTNPPGNRSASTVGREDREAYDRGLKPRDEAATDEDKVLLQNLRRMLYQSDQFNRAGDRISIIVAHGNVTLRGTVNSEEEIRAFGEAVRRFTGVRSLENQLQATGGD